ncbi:uncharacterized protein LOC130410554 [Triplophysa dalaica]|uniref:uncharacterized protein LOC130410554 n=1 Tax=Triplophysa dalaica TaxID=1582913 RepID=UPI0024DFCE30|nr:uncharacterized protein LOC130410554 [Triplophysa dalaica]
MELMELFIIVALHFLLEVQSYKGPNMKVSPDVVRESNSVHLNCESPADVTVIQCYFYANGEKYKNIKLSPSCDLSLTGAEVLLWTGLKSPVSLDIACYYTTDVSGVHQPSAHPTATLTILDDLIKPIMSVDESSDQISVSCLIPESVRTDFTCNLYTEDGPLRHRRHSQRSQSGEHHCVFFISLSEIFTHKQRVNRHLSCDYSVRTDPEMNLTSPRSDLYTIRALTSTPTANTTTARTITTVKTTSLALMSTGEIFTEIKPKLTSPQSDQQTVKATSTTTAQTTTAAMITNAVSTNVNTTNTTQAYSLIPSVPEADTAIWLLILSTAVGSVFVLTGLICLCRYSCKKITKRQETAEDTCASEPPEAYSLITSVPDTGLNHPQSHQDSKPGPLETYSLITSTIQPSDVLVHTQQKKGSTEENEGQHHAVLRISTTWKNRRAILKIRFQSNCTDRMFITCTAASLTNQ